MGSAAAAVEISSDNDDGSRTPGAGKRKAPDDGRRTPGAGKHQSPNDALEWADKLLGDDYSAIEEGLDDSSAMQEFLACLVDEKKSVCDGDDDDDDCVILDGDPVKAVAVAKEEGPRRDASEDELQIVAEKGELACRDFPHPRHLCASLPFSTSSHASHCSMCHCYVCDSPAPCAFWGKGTMLNDHCHATDKDAKWKKLRQASKRRSQQTPKRGGIQNIFQPCSTTPSSQPSANVMIPSTGRFPISSIASQNQQVHPSIMLPQNMGKGICLPRLPSCMPRTTIPSKISERARAASPVYKPSNVNHLQSSVPSCGPMQTAFPRAVQTAQVRPGVNISDGTFQCSPPLLPLRAATVSQGHQFQPLSYPHTVPNSTVGTGVQLSRCTSLSTQGTHHPRGLSADTRRWRDALANLAYELGVPDYNIDPALVQQSASTPHQSVHPNQLLAQAKTSQGFEVNHSYNIDPALVQQSASTPHRSVHPNQLLAQAKASQGFEVNHSYVAATAQMRPTMPNHASGAVLSSGSFRTDQLLCQLNSQSSLTSTERAQFPLPWNVDGN